MAKQPPRPNRQLELPVLLDVNRKQLSTDSACTPGLTSSAANLPSSRIAGLVASPQDQTIYKSISDNYFRSLKA